MKYLFEIDDRSAGGKNVIPLLKSLSKATKGINCLSEEEAEDRVLKILIRKSMKSGLAPQKRVMTKLGIK